MKSRPASTAAKAVFSRSAGPEYWRGPHGVLTDSSVSIRSPRPVRIVHQPVPRPFPSFLAVKHFGVTVCVSFDKKIILFAQAKKRTIRRRQCRWRWFWRSSSSLWSTSVCRRFRLWCGRTTIKYGIDVCRISRFTILFFQDPVAPLSVIYDRLGTPLLKHLVAGGTVFALITTYVLTISIDNKFTIRTKWCRALFYNFVVRSLIGRLFPIPRILYAMSGDGLLFDFLSKINGTTKTPFPATIVCGVTVGINIYICLKYKKKFFA